jgi:dolichyl-phosphate beta-glucosyltransferase
MQPAQPEARPPLGYALGAGPAGRGERAGDGDESAPAPFLSVAITAFNEAGRLPASLAHLLPWLEAQPFGSEVVVNDDGSTDATAAIVRDAAARYPGRVRLLQAPGNQGKGAGVRRAVLATRGQAVLFSDADFSTPIEEAPRLLARLDAGADVVIGSRIQPDGSDMRASQPVYRRLFGKLFHRLADPLLVRGVGDTQSGFKAFRGDVARALFRDCLLDSIIFDVEVLYLAQRRGYRVEEVPVRWTNAGGSRMRVSPGHAARVLLDLVRIPWLHRHDARGPLPQSVASVTRKESEAK